MAKTFVFPVVTGNEIVVEYNEEVENFIDEVIDRKTDIEVMGEKPTHLLLGKRQMEMVMAYVSYVGGKPVFPKDFDGIPIIVLDQAHFMDWVYDPIQTLMNDYIVGIQPNDV